MIPAIYKVLETEDAFLAIMPRPRPGEWLRDDLIGLDQMGVNCLVSMLEESEEADMILSHERELATELEMEFLSYPIEDGSVPIDIQNFASFVSALAGRVRCGRNVAVHCLAGIGRSGITVAAVLVALGLDPGTVFQQISQARGFPVPDTTEQMEWFEQNHSAFRNVTHERELP